MSSLPSSQRSDLGTPAGDVDVTEVDRIVESVGKAAEDVIAVLQALQEHFHYLPDAALRRVCEITEITPASITGVASFYSQFRRRPAGRHDIKVCIGTACHVKGAENVFEAFRRELGIEGEDDTDAERLFTVRKVACLGCCMLAPAVQIDDITYGHVQPATTTRVMRDFLASRRQSQKADQTAAGVEAPDAEVRLCLCSSCAAAGSRAVWQRFQNLMERTRLPVRVRVVGCTGISYRAPIVDIAFADGRVFRYGNVDVKHVDDILDHHFSGHGVKQRVSARASRLLERLLRGGEEEPVTRYCLNTREGADAAYVGRQCHLVMDGAGTLDPLDLDAYCTRGGFEGLRRCADMTPGEVIGAVTRSGLRGRGGAGYLTGRKWQHVKEAGNEVKYLICNGDEGDPGAFMDRMILESFPYRVIEGIAIACYAIGAREAIIYVRAEYPLAIERVREAVRRCRDRGLLRAAARADLQQVALRVVEGAGAFVCGEETALISAVEGRRGMPRYRPPYPATCGLRGKPTLVNNVETLAAIPWVLREGPEAFADIGTAESKGTKTFALAGKVCRGGLIEVPMGTTLREIIDEIGGGVGEGRVLKAIQVGGPAGGCVPGWLADTPVDYHALQEYGAIMGSGGLIALDDTDCMVDIARYFLAFTQEESCGKCTYCRVGTKRMLEIVDRLCEGRARPDDLEQLEHLAGVVRKGSLCGLGKSAPNPVLSTLRYFRDEYEAHVAGRCPAAKCRALIEYHITEDCIGCTRCAQRCPADAIPMTPYRQHSIDQDACVRCGTCRTTCPVDAVDVQ